MKVERFVWVYLFVFALIAAGCDGGGKNGGNGGNTQTNGAPDNGGGEEVSNSGEKKEVDPATAGSIKGTVTFKGKAKQKEIDVTDPKCKAALGEKTLYKEDLVVNDGKLQNAFVYIKKGLKGYKFATPAAASINQVDCHYEPHVIGVMVGQKVTVKNSDDLLHNINGNAAKKNPKFNFGQEKGAEDEIVIKLPETIAVACDVHGWMGCIIHVLRHPKFQVTGADGSFELSGVPPGEYEVVCWTEKLGEKTATVKVDAKGTAEANFEFEK